MPRLSIIVVVYNMRREAPRTLRSLAPGYQRLVESSDYEVVVAENGSPEPLLREELESFGSNFRYLPIADARPSPAHAINVAAQNCTGEFLALMIDGARMLTPGGVYYALAATKLADRPLVSLPSWHLGPAQQNKSILEGYNERVEDGLLARIEWPHDGYRLFEISAFAGSYRKGLFRTPPESNFLVLHRETFADLDGFDAHFEMPGGGLVNLDFFNRACELPDVRLIQVLGEGTFHQVHGGAATGAPTNRWKEFTADYASIRGREYAPPTITSHFFGHAPEQALGFLKF